MLLQPILQIHVLHPTGGQDLFPLPIHPRYHRIILVDVQRHVAAGTCTCFIFHATLSLGLLLGRGFSGRELHTPIRARGPDENPPGDQVTPRAEILTLSHRQRRSAQMLRAPDGIPGTTSPSGYHPPRPNPSYILVTPAPIGRLRRATAAAIEWKKRFQGQGSCSNQRRLSQNASWLRQIV